MRRGLILLAVTFLVGCGPYVELTDKRPAVAACVDICGEDADYVEAYGPFVGD